jgi:hypothetical protein
MGLVKKKIHFRALSMFCLGGRAARGVVYDGKALVLVAMTAPKT